MSLHWRWCVQPSAISTRSPSFRRFIASAPAQYAARSPFARAKTIEKLVSGTSGGTARATSPKACESVTTKRTPPERSRTALSCAGWQTSAAHPASRSSRTTCCCGRMRRPFGADSSMGQTHATTSPGATRSATSGRGASASFTPAIFAFSPSTESPRLYFSTGTFRARHAASKRISSALPASPSDATHTATSVFSSTSRERLTRSSPSGPSSSSPAVSVIRHGPSGSISIALETGSVVVPATSLTIAISCPVSALTSVDFPALRSPKNAMCVRFPDGVSLSSAMTSL